MPILWGVVAENFGSILHHAKDMSMSSAQPPKYKAKHAAYTVFLRKYARHVPFIVAWPLPPAPPDVKKGKK